MEIDKERNAGRLHEEANITVFAQFLHSNEPQEFNAMLFVPSSPLLSSPPIYRCFLPHPLILSPSPLSTQDPIYLQSTDQQRE